MANATLRRGVRGVLTTTGSLWLAAVLLVLLLIAMACATVFESSHGTEQALAEFYQAKWFEGLLVLLAIGVGAALVVRYPFSKAQIGFVLTHAAILLILVGAWVTKRFGVDGQLSIVEGDAIGSLQVSRETLTLTEPGTGAKTALDLNPSIFGRPVAAKNPRHAPLVTPGVRIEVERYVPDSAASPLMLNDNPTPRRAVQVSLSSSQGEEAVWVVAGQTARVGSSSVTLRAVESAEELRSLLETKPTPRGTSVGTVRVELDGTTYERTVEECLNQLVPIGQTPYSVRVLRYFNHATVGASNEIVNASDRPVNPAIQVEIAGPDGTDKRLAFARFPDFASMHGDAKASNVRVTLVASQAPAAAPPAPIEILSGPGAELRVRYAPADETPILRDVAVGEPTDTPLGGRRLTILQSLDHARLTDSIEPVDPIRENRIPAVVLKLTAGTSTTRVWVQKHQPRSVTLDGAKYDVAYADKSLPLGFSITLHKFTVGYYPGGNRPRSFESQVTMTDPGTGRSQSQVISMNHPTSYGGYTFYQSSYQLSGGRARSVLSVAKDPGQPIVFAGYIALLAGMVAVLALRVAERRRATAPAPAGHRGNGRGIPLVVPGQRCAQNAPGGLPRRAPMPLREAREGVSARSEVSK